MRREIARASGEPRNSDLTSVSRFTHREARFGAIENAARKAGELVGKGVVIGTAAVILGLGVGGVAIAGSSSHVKSECGTYRIITESKDYVCGPFTAQVTAPTPADGPWTPINRAIHIAFGHPTLSNQSTSQLYVWVASSPKITPLPNTGDVVSRNGTFTEDTVTYTKSAGKDEAVVSIGNYTADVYVRSVGSNDAVVKVTSAYTPPVGVLGKIEKVVEDFVQWILHNPEEAAIYGGIIAIGLFLVSLVDRIKGSGNSGGGDINVGSKS